MAEQDLDTISNWTIKAFPVSTREKVVRAAQIEGVGVASWLDKLIRSHLGDPSHISPPARDPLDLMKLSAHLQTLISVVLQMDDPVLKKSAASLVRKVTRLTYALLPAPPPRRLASGSRVPGSVHLVDFGGPDSDPDSGA